MQCSRRLPRVVTSMSVVERNYLCFILTSVIYLLIVYLLTAAAACMAVRRAFCCQTFRSRFTGSGPRLCPSARRNGFDCCRVHRSV